MHYHLVGIGGVFMGNLALLLRDLGNSVSGCDTQLYPPMSTLLQQHNIFVQSYHESTKQLCSSKKFRDVTFVIGNSVSRGNPLLEEILNRNLAYISGPQLLYQQVLKGREVLAIAGTHGKTTTTSMVAHICTQLGIDIGWLIGGANGNTRGSCLGSDRRFVIEADEYDSCLNDKRAKFMHYRPTHLLINNLEFDHADIYPNLAAIETQFHHLIRAMPVNGNILTRNTPAIERVLTKGCWSKVQFLEQSWIATPQSNGARIGYTIGKHITWHSLVWKVHGKHNLDNAVAAIALVHTLGVDWQQATDALSNFRLPDRRLSLIATLNMVDGSKGSYQLYTDFAHHPTAIRASLVAMREILPREQHGRLLVVLHPASNTMRSGIHNHLLSEALAQVDHLWLYTPGQTTEQTYFSSTITNENDDSQQSSHERQITPVFHGNYANAQKLAQSIQHVVKNGDCVITLSNGAIDIVHQYLQGLKKSR